MKFSSGKKEHFTGTSWSIYTKLWFCFKRHFYRIIRLVSMLQQLVLKENQYFCPYISQCHEYS